MPKDGSFGGIHVLKMHVDQSPQCVEIRKTSPGWLGVNTGSIGRQLSFYFGKGKQKVTAVTTPEVH